MAQMTATKTVSNNLSLTHENYLICRNVPIARTGVQVYHCSEKLSDYTGKPLPTDSSGMIEVTKSADVLFNQATMDSFEQRPVTLGHVMITPDNYKQYAVGLTYNVRRGTGAYKDNLVADLIIQDQKAIDIVRNNKMREISLGYEAAYISDGKGKAHQTAIIGNHIAIVPQGKAGHLCRIYDSVDSIERAKKLTSFKETIKQLFMQTVDSVEMDKALEMVSNEPNNQDQSASAQTPARPVANTQDNQSTDNSQQTTQTKDALPLNQPQQQPLNLQQPQAVAPQAAPVQSPTQQIMAKLDLIIQLLNQQGENNKQQATEQTSQTDMPTSNPKRIISINPNKPINQ